MLSHSHLLSHYRVLPPGEFNDMSSQSHVSRCRVGLGLTATWWIHCHDPRATLQGAVTWQNQCYDRANIAPSAILKIVYRHILLWTPAQRKRASMLYLVNVFYLLFMADLFSGPGLRKFAKVLHMVDLECNLRSYYLDFFLVILKLQGGPKSDKIWRIFRPHPQTFCSHARTRVLYHV